MNAVLWVLLGVLLALGGVAATVYVFVRRSSRAARVLHVLKDRPIAYRLQFESGSLVVRDDHTRVERTRHLGGLLPAIRVEGASYFQGLDIYVDGGWRP